MSADKRLASYGTLAPGEENFHQLDGLQGTWIKGVVRGRRLQADAGIWEGFPAFKMDASGEPVEVHIFQSRDLPDHWARLDAFEGEHYHRVITNAETDEGEMEVSIYEFKG